MKNSPAFRSTTVLVVRKENEVVMAGDGQVTFGDTVIKNNARKIRKIYQDKVLLGFAGATADAFTLFEKFEAKLESFSGNLKRAAVEMAKEWRTDRVLRRLEAMLLVADASGTYLISGSGDVLEPDQQVIAVGSGANFAKSAALALLRHSSMNARAIALEALGIAADICIYTNHDLSVEELA